MKNDNRYRDDANRYYENDRNRRYNNPGDYDDYKESYDRRSAYNDYPPGDNENRYSRYDNYNQGRSYRDNRSYDSEYSKPYRPNNQSDYYRNEYQNRSYRNEYPLNENRGRNETDYNGRERSWWDRTADEVSSWFGDEDAERRRRMDDIREYNHRGKGPKNYKRSPERIKDDVNDKLSDNWMIDASNIEVEVQGSEVTLNGTVDSRETKRRAEDVAESVSGVTNVQNNLKVNKISFDTDSTKERTDSSLSNSSYSNGARKRENMSHN